VFGVTSANPANLSSATVVVSVLDEKGDGVNDLTAANFTAFVLKLREPQTPTEPRQRSLTKIDASDSQKEPCPGCYTVTIVQGQGPNLDNAWILRVQKSERQTGSKTPLVLAQGQIALHP